MNDFQRYFSSCLLAAAALLGSAPAGAAGAPALGAASSFAVLSAGFGGTGAVTCTDSSITGDVGSSGLPISVTQTGCTITGAVVAPVATKVLTDFNAAYGQYANIPCTASLNPVYTGEITLLPGVYCSAAAVTFTDATLTLDAQGDPNAVWIFKVGTGGTGALTGTNLAVVLTNGAQPCNVSWWVAEAVTMTTSGFQGNILAGAAITMTGVSENTIVSFNGNALSKAAVTLTGVTVSGCQGTSGPGNSRAKCNQGVGNGPEGCDPGNSNQSRISPFGPNSNDEVGGVPGNPGRKGGNKK